MHLLLAVLEVLLLGTGFPRPDPQRAGPSTAVVIGEKWFVVDAGRGTTMRLAATDLKYENLRGVFLTHLHSDHTAGLPDLFDTSWQFGRKTVPLQLYGPPGTKKLAGAMLDFFAEDIHVRRDLMEKHPAAGATIDTHIVREGVVYDDG
jgi:ribonuclease Z